MTSLWRHNVSAPTKIRIARSLRLFYQKRKIARIARSHKFLYSDLCSRSHSWVLLSAFNTIFSYSPKAHFCTHYIGALLLVTLYLKVNLFTRCYTIMHYKMLFTLFALIHTLLCSYALLTWFWFIAIVRYPLWIISTEGHITRDDHQNLKLLLIDLNQMHLIGLVERTILVLNHLNRMFRCKVMAFRVLDFYIGLQEHFKKFLRGF